MPISFTCNCGAKLQAKDDKAGALIDCPKCGGRLTIPGGDDSGELADVPTLKRMTHSGPGPVEAADVIQGGGESTGFLYPACRMMRVVFIVSGWLSLAMSMMFVVMVANAIDGGGLVVFMQAVTLVITFGVGGFGQFALAELLGGVVNYLLKHDCKPTI